MTSTFELTPSHFLIRNHLLTCWPHLVVIIIIVPIDTSQRKMRSENPCDMLICDTILHKENKMAGASRSDTWMASESRYSCSMVNWHKVTDPEEDQSWVSRTHVKVARWNVTLMLRNERAWLKRGWAGNQQKTKGSNASIKILSRHSLHDAKEGSKTKWPTERHLSYLRVLQRELCLKHRQNKSWKKL